MNDDQNHTNSSHDSHSAGSHQTESHQTGAMGSDKSLAFPSFNFSKLDFAGHFKKTLDVFLFKKGSIEVLAKDSSSNAIALVFLLLGMMVGPLSYALIGRNILGFTYRPDFIYQLTMGFVSTVVLFGIFYALTWVVNNQLKGKGIFEEYFRVMASVSVIFSLLLVGYIVPAIMMILVLAIIVLFLLLNFQVVKSLFSLDMNNAVLVSGLLLVLLLVFSYLNLGPISYSAVNTVNVGITY